MADELLSIDTDNLDALANAIKDKAGVSRSTKLAFPSEFVSTLQTIETEATVTPKIAAQQKVLTPSDTSFAIASGFHDGTGTVSIQTETGSANPTSTQQTYYPSTGKFFSSFYVGGLGAGYVVFTGEITASNARDITVNGLTYGGASITPVGMAVVRKTDANLSSTAFLGAFFAQGYDIDHSIPDLGFGLVLRGSRATFSSGSASIGCSSSYSHFTGTYKYIIWGT